MITENEILEALRQAMTERPDDDEGMTVHEIAGLMCVGEKRTRGLVRILLARGRMVRGYRRVEKINGVVQPVPVYRLA